MTTVQKPYCHDDVPCIDYDARFPFTRNVFPESKAERIAKVAALSESALDRSYSAADVAALMGISYNTIQHRIRSGTLPFAGFRIGNAWRFARHDVHAWISEQEESAA